MRLSQDNISEIIAAINHHVTLQQAELRLFGSRTNTNKKGGDIDLLLVLPDADLHQTVVLRKIAILIEIQQKIGEQKIDLVLAVREDLEKDPFLKLIFPSSLLLHTWG